LCNLHELMVNGEHLRGYAELMSAGSLKWESIDGAKFDVTKILNPNFFLSHRYAFPGLVIVLLCTGTLSDQVSPAAYVVTLACRISMGMREVDLGDTDKVLRTASPEYTFSATVANEAVGSTPVPPGLGHCRTSN
jgi:hypothetical protein